MHSFLTSEIPTKKYTDQFPNRCNLYIIIEISQSKSVKSFYNR